MKEKQESPRRRCLLILIEKIPNAMKLTFLFLVISLLSFTATASAQRVSIVLDNAKVEKVLATITHQTGLSVAYSKQIVDLNRRVSVNFTNAELTNVLDKITEGTSLSYEVKNGKIYLFEKPIANAVTQQAKKITGVVVDSKGEPIIGANVVEKGTTNGTITDFDGKFILPSLSHKNLPLAMFLETSDLGYPAWSGSKTEKANDEDIIRALGLGIVRFNEVVTPEVIEADYEYRVDTDVITAVTVSGGQSDPDNSVTVTFSILGRSYKVENVYYPEDGQQLVWVKWHTPSTEQHITISVTASGGSASVSRGTITANIVDLDDNPPPNPVADDRNDSYRKENAVMPVNPEKTQAAWSVWKAKWKEKWVWHSDWNWESEDHSASCEAGCTQSHGYWQDDGEYVDEGWWEFEEKHYSASLTADMHLVTDEKAPTADGMVTKSGYGVNVSLSARASSSQTSATTAPQTAVSYFPEFYYETYWRLLERTRNGYSAVFEFKNNEYSTYYRRTHFTPVWMPDGEYRVYTYLLDCWTPDGMLSVNLSDAVQISGSLWDDWHIAPQNVR